MPLNSVHHYVQKALAAGKKGDIAYPQLSNKFKPIAGSLNAFMGDTMAGTWELKVIDYAADSKGTLQQWCLYPELEFVALIFKNGFE